MKQRILALAVLSVFALPGAALAQQKLKFGHVYETSEPYHKWAVKATDEIAVSEQKLVDDFATKYKKTVVKSDRAAFQQVFLKFHNGPDATWDKALYDKVQAIK